MSDKEFNIFDEWGNFIGRFRSTSVSSEIGCVWLIVLVIAFVLFLFFVLTRLTEKGIQSIREGDTGKGCLYLVIPTLALGCSIWMGISTSSKRANSTISNNPPVVQIQNKATVTKIHPQVTVTKMPATVIHVQTPNIQETATKIQAVTTNIIKIPDTIVISTQMMPTLTPDTSQKVLQWDLVSDFRIAPNNVNPSPDSLGNNDVWYYMRSNSLSDDPSKFELLSNFKTNAYNIDNFQWWFSPNSYDGTPYVAINATGKKLTYLSFTVPIGGITVHPGSGKYVIIGWQSPILGNVSLSGTIKDLDPNCGDGIIWYINQGSKKLVQKVLPSGEKENFLIPQIEVQQGDFLYLLIGPNNSYNCDSTGISLIISPTK
jgi:uncharacterized protein YneF (UPF0154 family)